MGAIPADAASVNDASMLTRTVSVAVFSAGQPGFETRHHVVAQENGAMTVSDSEDPDIGMGLPVPPGAKPVVRGGNTIFQETQRPGVVVQSTAGRGFRALVELSSASSPREYRFPFKLPPGGQLVQIPTSRTPHQPVHPG
jgi:hypothetical protein